MKDSAKVLGMRVDRLEPEEAVDMIIDWCADRRSRYICVSNVHQCMEAFDDATFSGIVNGADLVIPDSQILAWATRFVGSGTAPRVIRGVDLMKRLCERAAEDSIRIGLYGGTPASLERLKCILQQSFPALQIAHSISPPFRDLSDEENLAYAKSFGASGTNLLFVGIGCPKQERWMAAQSGQIGAVMIGVGAAFDFISGVTRPSPNWIHPLGLEWMYRLCLEPRRLWKRYFKHNPRFLFYLFLQRLEIHRSRTQT